MSTARVYIGVFFRFFQFVGNVGCFATSVNTLRPYNAFILTVTVLNFIYNCYIWFGVPIIGGLKAYNGILLGGEISFSFCTLGVLCSKPSPVTPTIGLKMILVFLLIPIVTMQVGLLALFVLHFTSLHL